jgi:peptidoglycan DL-endopeptidase CwlO
MPYLCGMVRELVFAAVSLFAGPDGKPEGQSRAVLADSVVNYAQEFLGTPYLWAGCSPKGFDCSGFVNYVFARFGYRIERSSSGLSNSGKTIAFEEAARGDLMLFRGTNPSDPTVGHVGIIIDGGDSLRFIHASSSKKHPGVVITDYHRSNYPSRFVGVRRVF